MVMKMKKKLFNGEYIELFSPIHMIFYKCDDTSRFSASIFVPFGSNMEDYFINDKRLPFGTAHFLEHMLFYNGSLEYSDLFSLYGAQVNATTFYDSMYFYFDGLKNNSLQCVNFLFEMFFHFKTLKRRIDMERNVILCEAKEDLSDPYSRLSIAMQKELYDDFSYGHNIIGNVNDIEKIDKSFLELAYKAFFRKENITFIACGNFDLDSIISFVSSYKYPQYKKMDIKRIDKRPHIENNINQETFKEVPFDIFHKEYLLDIEEIEPFKENLYIYKNFLSAMFDYSHYMIKGIEDGHFDSDFSISIESNDNRLSLAFQGALLDEKSIPYLDSFLNKPEDYITEEDKTLFIKKYYARGLKSTLHPHDILSRLNFILGQGEKDPYKYICKYQDIDLEDFIKFVKVLANSKQKVQVIWRNKFIGEENDWN